MSDSARRRVTRIALCVWVTTFAAYVVQVGVPTKRSNVLVWLVLAIVALGVGRPRATARALLLDWSPIILALVAYDALRGISDGAGRVAHVDPQLAFDSWLGGGTPLTVHLQGWLHPTDAVRWWDYGAWAVYTSHFLLPLGIAVVLWAIGSPRFRPYLLGLALLSWMALLTYWLYPAQPPWMTGQDGLHEPVARVVHGVWDHVGVHRAARVFEPSTPQAASRYSNPVAALPSLHGAFPMFIFLMLRGIRRWLTALLAVYVVAMGLTLVYAGEHFAFDVFMGWGYAAGAAALVLVAARRLRREPIAELLVEGLTGHGGGNGATADELPGPVVGSARV